MKKSPIKHKPAASGKGGVQNPTGDRAGGSARKSNPIRDGEEVRVDDKESGSQANRSGEDDPIKEEKEARDYGRTIHNGSAGAFDATEHSHDEDDDDQDNDDFAMDR